MKCLFRVFSKIHNASILLSHSASRKSWVECLRKGCYSQIRVLSSELSKVFVAIGPSHPRTTGKRNEGAKFRSRKFIQMSTHVHGSHHIRNNARKKKATLTCHVHRNLQYMVTLKWEHEQKKWQCHDSITYINSEHTHMRYEPRDLEANDDVTLRRQRHAAERSAGERMYTVCANKPTDPIDALSGVLQLIWHPKTSAGQDESFRVVLKRNAAADTSVTI